MLADNVCSGADALKKHRAARMLVDVRGRVEAMMVLRDKGISALITCLDGILPPLVAAGELLYRSSFPQPHTICILQQPINCAFLVSPHSSLMWVEGTAFCPIGFLHCQVFLEGLAGDTVSCGGAAPDVSKDKDRKAKKVPKHVELRAAVALLHDAEKSGKAQTALQLLHAVISASGGAHMGLAAADTTGIKVAPPRSGVQYLVAGRGWLQMCAI